MKPPITTSRMRRRELFFSVLRLVQRLARQMRTQRFQHPELEKIDPRPGIEIYASRFVSAIVAPRMQWFMNQTFYPVTLHIDDHMQMDQLAVRRKTADYTIVFNSVD